MSLQFESASGHVFYLNHLISAFFTFCGGWAFFYFLRKNMRDKAIHLAVCAAITFGCLHLFSFIDVIAWWWAPIVAIVVGIAKEFFDLKKKGLFDFVDIVADFIGIVTVTLIYICSFLLYGK